MPPQSPLLEAFRRHLRGEKRLIKGVDGCIGVVETCLVALVGQEATARMDAPSLAAVINAHAPVAGPYLRGAALATPALALAWRRFAAFLKRAGHEIRVTVEQESGGGGGGGKGGGRLSSSASSAASAGGGGAGSAAAGGGEEDGGLLAAFAGSDGAAGPLSEAGLVAALREEVVALRKERRELKGQAGVQERVVRRLEEVGAVRCGACMHA